VSPRRAGRGFTLLEVMVAMAILALSLTAAFEVVGGAMQNHLRARRLELATLLARAKLAEVEAKFEEDGFRDFDQSEDGSFGDEGHPEIKWEVKTTKPTMELGADGVIKALTGAEGGLAGLLGLAPGGQASGGGPTTDPKDQPIPPQIKAIIDQQLTALGEEIKKGVRQVRLTVSWEDGRAKESFTVATTMVVLTPGSQKGPGQ
jgi:general secretion pathway protein I